VLPDGPDRNRLLREVDRTAAAYAPLRLHSAPRGHDLVPPWVRGYVRRPTLRWLDRIDIIR